MTPEQKLEAAQRWARSQLWHQGVLSYKYHATQAKIAEALDASQARKFFLLCSRRLGKSYLLVCRAIEMALRKPNARVLFLAPFQRDAADIANDLAAQILADCPEALKPDYNSQAKELRFKNGSIIRLKGTNNEKADTLRGGASDLIIIDECGQVDNLQYIVQSVCLPMTLTTGGKILLASTPPPTPAHDSARIYAELLEQNATVKFTLLDAPHISDAVKAEILQESGEAPEDIPGILVQTAYPKTTAARRELFAEFVVDTSVALVPEFDAAAKAEIVQPTKLAPYYFAYTGIDPGSRDKTGIIVGWVDFLNGRFVVEGEALLANPTTREIAETVKHLEREYLPSTDHVTRVSDIDLRLIHDLFVEHRLQVQKARKSDMLQSVQQLRHYVQTRRLSINPRCTNLVHQLETCIWDKRGKDMAREGDAVMAGHHDLIAALRYTLRAIDWQRNPYPESYRARGGPLGPGVNDWVSPRRISKKRFTLLDNTPFGKKLAKRR